MPIHTLPICVDSDQGCLEDVPAAISFTAEFFPADHSTGDHFDEWNVQAEILDADWCGLTLSRDQLVTVLGAGEVIRQEALAAEQIANGIECDEIEPYGSTRAADRLDIAAE